MLLKIGSTGEDVKKLQTKLGTASDGTFGPGTEKLVKEFQTKNGLTSDGIVGDGTWSKMFGAVIKEDVVIPSSGGSLKLEKLKGHVPDSVINQIPEVVEKFKINTPLRLSHFLSQCSHESANFTVTSENLNYKAKGLLLTFKKYFINESVALPYEKQPAKIANKVYANRMGNGSESSGDGYKFRGRGFVQLTGKDNYISFGKAINEDLVSNPDLVSTKYPLLSASWFFTRCLTKCDDGSTRDVVESVTKCVNGGLIGIDERYKNFVEFYKLLS